MKRSKIEKRLREEVNSLTPNPPSFDEIDKRVDWEEIASSIKPPKRRSWAIPAAISASICLVLTVVSTTLILRFAPFSDAHKNSSGGSSQLVSTQASAGESQAERPLVFGEFAPKWWWMSDDAIDLSGTSLVISDQVMETQAGVARLENENGVFCGSACFSGFPFDVFVFGDLMRVGDYGSFKGSASCSEIDSPFLITPSDTLEEAKRVKISFGEPNTIMGLAVYQLKN